MFDSCLFSNCKAQNGGAIYLKAGSAVTLSVTKGQFDSCKATSYRGGGIYAEGIKTVIIEESLFHTCVAAATNNYGGGGIQLWNIHQPFTVESSMFISCQSGNDGGAICLSNTPSWQSPCLFHSFYIQCKATSPTASGGGAMLLWDCNAVVGCF